MPPRPLGPMPPTHPDRGGECRQCMLITTPYIAKIPKAKAGTIHTEYEEHSLLEYVASGVSLAATIRPAPARALFRPLPVWLWFSARGDGSRLEMAA
jgi:hypothetical protein